MPLNNLIMKMMKEKQRKYATFLLTLPPDNGVALCKALPRCVRLGHNSLIFIGQ